MFTIRQILVRMRQGDTDRSIARAGLMGRKKLGLLRRQAAQWNWLDSQQPLPEDAELAAALQRRPEGQPTQCISSLREQEKRIARVSGPGYPGHHHPCGPGAAVWLRRQLLRSQAADSPDSRRRAAAGHLPVDLRPGRGRPGGFRRRPATGRSPDRGAAQVLVFRDDPMLVAASVRQGDDLAGLPSPRFQLVWGVARADHHR